MLLGQELYWNTIQKQRIIGALQRFKINRWNGQTLTQSPAQQNGLKSLFFKERNKILLISSIIYYMVEGRLRSFWHLDI